MNVVDVSINGQAARIAIAVARFNTQITEMMLDGCVKALAEHQVSDDHITVVRVPGAWELPLVCQQLADSNQFDAIIALGAVVRGETAHFDFISGECAHGLAQVSLSSSVPVAFGVLTPENAEQAFARADPTRKDKGREAALAALEMVALTRAIQHD